MQRNVTQHRASAIVTCLAILFNTQLAAQTFATLHNFAGGNGGNYPMGEVALSGNSLYGTTTFGGTSAAGTVFKVNIDGTDFLVLYNFTAPAGNDGTNSDGGAPWGGVIVAGNVLYGTARLGGSAGNGTVFKVNADGTGFATLYSFSALATNPPYGNSDGNGPRARLTLSGTTLYGTTYFGGYRGNGALFKINTNGTGFTVLHSFSDRWLVPPYSNYDGAFPSGGLVVSDGTLYGTTVFGGGWGNGTLFKVNSDGTDFANLHSFSGSADGASPYAGVVLASNTLYGTASAGGLGDNGAVFKINTDGTGFTNLYTFSGFNTNNGNADGANPMAGLILSSNTLFGTASHGGNSGNGTIFKVNTDGTGFGLLYSFDADDALPLAGLILGNNTLYGTASGGGSNGNGLVFSFLLTPTLTIRWIPSGPHIRLLWSTNATGYALQASSSLFSSLWTNVSAPPVISAGQNAVTQPVLGTQLLYRLSQQ